MTDLSILSEIAIPPGYEGRVFVHPNIPNDLLGRTLQKCPLSKKDEIPLVLIDITPRGWLKKPGQQAILVTTEYIYDSSDWPNDLFLPAVRSIPLAHIVQADIAGSFAALKDAERIHVNGHPLMGVKQPEFDGLSGREFLDWVVKVIQKIAAAKNNSAKGVSDVVLSYQSLLKKDGLFYHGTIPADILNNAVSSYAPISSPDQNALLLYNYSGKGKAGVVITSDTLFSSLTPETKFSWNLDSIRKVWVGHTKSWKTLYLYVVIDDKRVFGWPHNWPEKNVSQLFRPVFAFANMIITIHNLFKPGSTKFTYPIGSLNLLESGVNFTMTEEQWKWKK